MVFDTVWTFSTVSAIIAVILVLLVPLPVWPRSALLAPLWISFVILVCLVIVITVLLRLDRISKRTTSPSSRQRHALRPLTFTSPSAWSAVLTRNSWETTKSLTAFPTISRSGSSTLNARLDSIFELVRSTSILPWYTRISPSPAFPDAIEILVRKVIADVSDRAEKVDWATVFVSRILPIVQYHLHHYRSVEHLTSSSSSTSASNSAIPLPLPMKAHVALSEKAYLPSGSSSLGIEAHFRGWLKKILGHALPKADRTEVVKTLAREIILGAAVLPTFEMMCDSDFWNRQIDEKGGRYLHEQKQVNRFLYALSTLQQPAASPGVTPQKRASTSTGTQPIASSITAASSTKQFDSFIRSISRLKTLGEARRLRADIEREQRAAKLALEELEEQTDGSREVVSRLRRASKYVKRLDQAKLEVDARIAVLSRHQGQASSFKSPQSSIVLPASTKGSIDLYKIIFDPASLAYWLEYMDRRGRSRLVQFWLTVEGFKDPLEAAGEDTVLGSALRPADDRVSGRPDQTIGEDVTFLYETYFVMPEISNCVPPRDFAIIKDFVEGGSGLLDTVRAQQLRQAVFSSQKAVYEQMVEDDWVDFRKSELYLKAVTELSRSPTVDTRPSLPVKQPGNYQRPTHRQRQMTAPPGPIRYDANVRSQPPRPLPFMINGNFTPLGASPSTSIATAPPNFDRTVTESSPTPRKTSASDVDMNGSIGSLPVTPPYMPHRSSHLDTLMTDDQVGQRGRLFEDDEDARDDADEDDRLQLERMEAIQAALNDIIASDSASTKQNEPLSPIPDSLKSPSSSMVIDRSRSERDDYPPKLVSRSVEDLRGAKPKRNAHASAPQSRIPSAAVAAPVLSHRASLSHLSLPKQQDNKLFTDDTIAHDEGDPEGDEMATESLVQFAAPGDLQLSTRIARLQDKLLELVKQEHLLDTLIRQAELTGKQNELRILRRSQASIRREQRSAIFQKRQFEQQEEENRLVPGRTSVTIRSTIVTADERDRGKNVVRYIIGINQIGEDGQVSVGWTVARRYNEFWELDRALRDWTMGEVRMLDDWRKIPELPPKKLVPNMSSSFVESRRIGLERYLCALTTSASLCDSTILRAFLSRSTFLQKGVRLEAEALETTSPTNLAPHNIVKSLYKTMTTSIDDALLTPNMIDLMYTSLNRQLSDVAEGFGAPDLAGLGSSLLPRANNETNPPPTPTQLPATTMQSLGGESGLGSFTSPICDLFVELFDLKESNNWLRRQAIVVILQQFLGGTIERKVRDTLRSATSAESIERTLASLEETLWPDGKLKEPSEPRSEAEKIETKIRASRKLGLLIPDVMANMIGRSNARRAARRVFGMLQDRRLNEQLMLCILDEVLAAIFPAAA